MNLTPVIFLLVYVRCVVAMRHVEGELMKQLFANYTPCVRPVLERKTPIVVTFNMKLMRILAVEEKNQKLVSCSVILTLETSQLILGCQVYKCSCFN